MTEFNLQNAEMVKFEAKEASRELWAAYHAYRRIRHADLRPDDPITPDEIIEDQMKKDDPFGKSHSWFILHEGKVISGFGTWESYPNAPGYESNKHLFWCGASVLKEYRRHGLGTMWARKALDIATQWDKTVLGTGGEEEEGFAFLEWIGAGKKMEAAENRLRFEEVDWDMVEKWIDQAQSKSPETKLEFYENKIPEGLWEEYSPKISELLMTMPFDDLDHGDIVVTPETMKEQQDRFDMRKAEHHTFITREPDGSISGMTDVHWVPDRPTYVEQWFTGVDPKARGRGLGKWLKASMLDFLRNRYANIEWVITDNANSNAPMLAINTKLGFKEFKGNAAYQMKRDELEAFLAATDKGKVPIS